MQEFTKPTYTAGSDHTGHRQRVKKRFDETGLAGFSEHEVVEFLLFYAIRTGDTKPAAKRLLKRFGSIEAVLAAKPESLTEVAGIGPESARLIRFLRLLTEHVMKARVHGTVPTISSISDLIKYLGTSMANLPEEQFRVIFVDHANTVIKDEILSQGVEDQTAVYPRQVMRRALALHATGILVVHNHPTGFLHPSQADRDITRVLKTAAGSLDIRFLDHIIIGREGKGYFSFRENGLLV